MKYIKRFFDQDQQNDYFHQISESTWNDLNMDQVFETIDYTTTKYGQQYLYESLRNIKKGSLKNSKIEIGVNEIKDNPLIELQIIKKLENISKNDSYHFCDLFLNPKKSESSFFLLYTLLSISSILLTILSFFNSTLIVPLIINMVINFYFHYREKLNSLSDSFKYAELATLLIAVRSISGLLERIGSNIGITPDKNGLDFLIRKCSLFKINISSLGELSQMIDYFFELIKSMFLLEIIFIQIARNGVREKTDMIKNNFVFISHIDLVISIYNIRKKFPNVNIPTETDDFLFVGREIFHPLIPDGVKNDFDFNENGILITGANMSGKSTFLRTLGINTILAMTINCFFGKFLSLPKTKIYTSISKSDSVIENKSLFYREAELIKLMCDKVGDPEYKIFLIDEIFSGTNSLERQVIASVILNYLIRNESQVICTTHDLQLPLLLKGFNYFYFSGTEGDFQYNYDYKIKKGILTTTNAVIVLKDLGYPDSLISEMKSKLKS
jgi:hypothetical protein